MQSSVVNYRDQVKVMLNKGERRLIVNLDDLRDYGAEDGDGRRFCEG